MLIKSIHQDLIWCQACEKQKRLKARGLCSACYQSKPGSLIRRKQKFSWKRGTLLATRFWAYIDKSQSCWEWQGCKNSDGYGNISINGKVVGAHRVSYQLNIGEIPDKMHVLHRCNNPACVNPKHLYLGDHKQNMKDKAMHGRGKTIPKCGEDHYKSKNTNTERRDAIKRRYNGETLRSIANDYGVCEATICRWFYNRDSFTNGTESNKISE